MGRRATVAGQRLAGATVGTEQTKLETKAILLRKNEPYIHGLFVCGGPPNVRYYGTLVWVLWSMGE